MPEVTRQHRSVTPRIDEPVAEADRPATGPITVMSNDPSADLERAIKSAGGSVVELGPETRALIWGYGMPAFGFGLPADHLAEVLDTHPKIGWVQLPSAGIDAYLGVIAQHTGLLWTSAKGAFSQPVAEHALMLTLALLRILRTRIEARTWASAARSGGGTSLYGLTVVIVGAGGIAVELMRLFEPFGVTVVVVRRTSEPVAGASVTVTADRLHDVLPVADVVVIAAAATSGNRRMFGQREFAAMKPTSVIVNIARGSLVDTDALTAALADGVIAGAGLDVTDPEPLPDGHPLWTNSRVIITPHAADTPEMVGPLLEDRVSENVAAFLGDGRFIGVVDIEAGY